MKKCTILMTIGLTALVASFLLPQKAQESFCSIDCQFGSCSMFELGEQVSCKCSLGGVPVCEVS